VSEQEPPTHEQIAELLALIVHDLRNPAATIGANVAFVREVRGSNEGSTSPDELDALADATTALADLMNGFEQLATIARAIGGTQAPASAPADIASSLESFAHQVPNAKLALELDVDKTPLFVRGGTGLARILAVLLANSLQHAPGKPVRLCARRVGDDVVVELCDQGRALAPELRIQAFTLGGQRVLKGRSDGRYGRVAGLAAARIMADAIGARLEADGSDGAAVFRLTLAIDKR